MSNIEQALKSLQNGDLVAIPTETVYGLAADARQPDAVKKIFAAKGRPADHPLIVHLHSKEQLNDWAKDIPDSAWISADIYWPGPLTLILKKQDHVSDIITGGQDTVGLRIPNHPLTLELLKEFNGAVCAPSANKFGRISPTSAAHVRDEFGDELKVILDGGECTVGIESTILDLSGEQPTLLRPGNISKTELEAALNTEVQLPQRQSPRVSGSLASHYAPEAETQLIDKTEIAKLDDKNTIGLLCFDEFNFQHIQTQRLSNNPKAYAHDLYAKLRKLDQLNLDCIYIEAVPATIEWQAVNDRVTRASCESSRT